MERDHIVPPGAEPPLEELWGRTPARMAPAAPPAQAAPPPPRRRHPVRALLEDPRALRRAVVLAMVLGPCRAEEPPER